MQLLLLLTTKPLSSEELDSAKLIAREIGITHHIIEYSELDNENFVRNDEEKMFLLS